MRKNSTVTTYPDTGLNTYVKNLNQYVKAITFPFLEELQLCERESIVYVADKLVNNKVDELIAKVDEIPAIVVGRDAKVGIKDKIEMHTVMLKPYNGAKPLQLEGYYTYFYGEINIVVIARQQAVAREIAKSILTYNAQWRKTAFDAIFEDVAGDKYLCKDLSSFTVLESKEHEFSDSVDKDIGLAVMGAEYQYKELSIRLKSKDYYPVTGVGICRDS